MFFRRQNSVVSADIKLIVGLGNIGARYVNTRHNIGFEVLDEVARLHNGRFRAGKFRGEELTVHLDGRRVLLLKPHTLMNLSGDSVTAAMRFYKLSPAQLLIICDDVNLPVGKLRLRPRGSDGGHNGLWHIIHRLNNADFARLRLGVGEKPVQMDLADYVLGHFLAAERTAMNDARDRAVKALECWVSDGSEAAMNRWNG